MVLHVVIKFVVCVCVCVWVRARTHVRACVILNSCTGCIVKKE